ncbi:MAG TPA: hypothetical protein VLA25_04845, partial [Methylotenera sp.]|nr:hypothetical protein [Methylotenera sp.]
MAPWQDVSDEGGNNHYQQDDYTSNPNQLTGLGTAVVVHTTQDVEVYYYEEQRSTISMSVAQDHTRWDVSHQVLYTSEGVVYVTYVVHSEQDTSQHLTSQHDTGQGTTVPRPVQVHRGRI